MVEWRVSVPAKQGRVVGPVLAGETWCFRARGRWWDAFVPAGPAGYRFFLADILDVYPVARGQPYFKLIGRLQEHPAQVYPIGREAVVTFAESGTLELIANDADGWAFNNWGAIEVEASRCDLCPPPAHDLTVYTGVPGLWRLLLETVERTKGVVSTAVLAVGAPTVLAFTHQGRDLVRSVAEARLEEGAGWRHFLFVVALLFLAVQAWIWPRLIINSNYGSDPAGWRPKALLSWGPRLLGASPFVLVLIALALSPAPNWLFTAFLLVLGLVFFAAVVVQRDLRRRVNARVMHKRGAPAKIGRAWVLANLALAFGLMVWVVASPVSFGWFLGAPAVVFFGVGCIIPVLVIVIQTGAAARVPALLLLIIAGAIFSCWVDNHRVGWRAPRLSAEAPSAARQQTLGDAYRLWTQRAPPDRPDGGRTMVLVAAEGGASRAGYWTGEVLSALHEATGGALASRLFAISSVSGGSVGAVAYAATLQDRPGVLPNAVRPAVADFTGRDFLSPTLGAMLFPDLLQRLIPWPLLPDRAQGLEEAFETAWSRHCERLPGCRTPELARRPFTELGPADGVWRPIVIINGASQETGRRILTSVIRFDASEVDADDFYEIMGRDVPVSTAIHNGARFPWVSPAGTLAKGHIVDGGYFEAAGVEVLREMAAAIRAGPGRNDRLHFIFVVIGYRNATEEAKPAKPKRLGGEDTAPGQTLRATGVNDLLGPIHALLNSRSGHAAHLMRELKVEASGDPRNADPFLPAFTQNADYEPVMLCDQRTGPPEKPKILFEPPMNWALSDCAKAYMRQATGLAPTQDEMKVCADVLTRRLPCPLKPEEAIRRIAAGIGGPRPPPPPQSAPSR